MSALPFHTVDAGYGGTQEEAMVVRACFEDFFHDVQCAKEWLCVSMRDGSIRKD